MFWCTDHSICVLQVPLFKVTHEGLSEILLDYKGRYNTVVGVRPTGWALQSMRGKVIWLWCWKRLLQFSEMKHLGMQKYSR